jgi:hypothetical protein
VENRASLQAAPEKSALAGRRYRLCEWWMEGGGVMDKSMSPSPPIFLLCLTGLLACSITMAAEPQNAPPKEAGLPKASCFELLKRKWPEVQSGNYPVCRDFVQNLNRYCGEPPLCERKIDPAIKSLSSPDWKVLDPKQYLFVIGQMLRPDWRESGMQAPIEPEIMDNIHAGKVRFEHVWIDLDRDGRKEHVVRFADGRCKATNRDEKTGFFYFWNYRMAVVDEQVSRVDSGYRHVVEMFHDITIHDRRPYGLRWDFVGDGDSTQGVALYEPFAVPFSQDRGSVSVCVFQYLR